MSQQQKKKVSEESDVGSLKSTEEIIKQRAYKLFEQRGFEHGHDLDDWLQAESEMAGKKPSSRADLKTGLHKAAAA